MMIKEEEWKRKEKWREESRMKWENHNELGKFKRNSKIEIGKVYYYQIITF